MPTTWSNASMPYSISVTFGDSETMRRGMSALMAHRAIERARLIERFISKLELRTTGEGHSRSTVAVFKVGLVEQIVCLKVKAERSELAERMTIAQGRLRSRGTWKPKRAPGNRVQVVGRAGISEIPCQSPIESLCGEHRVLVPRDFVSLPHAGYQRNPLTSIGVGVGSRQLQRACGCSRCAEFNAAGKPAAGIAITSAAAQRIGKRSDGARCVKDNHFIQSRIEIGGCELHSRAPQHLIDTAVDRSGAVGTQSDVAVERVTGAAVKRAEPLVK